MNLLPSLLRGLSRLQGGFRGRFRGRFRLSSYRSAVGYPLLLVPVAAISELRVKVLAAFNYGPTVRPLMNCFASEINHCGGVGSGQVTKILNNMVLFQTVTALSEAYAIAHHAGVDTNVLFDALTTGSADSFALRNHGMKAILPCRFPTRAFSVEYAKKDLRYALELAGDGSIDANGARNVLRLFEKAIEAGVGDQYFPVVSRILNRELS